MVTRYEPQHRRGIHTSVGEIVDQKHPQGADHADGAPQNEKHQVLLPSAELEQLIA